MERLTYRKDGKAVNRNCYDWCATCTGAECLEVQKFLDRLAAYDDAEEQGLLVRLPCKVGDTVFVPDKKNKAVRDIEVSYYNVEDKSIVAVCTFDCTNYGCPCVFADWRWDGEESACSAYGCFVF